MLRDCKLKYLGSRGAVWVLSCCLAVTWTPSVGAWEGQAEARDFELTRDWVLQRDGHPVAGAQIYYSKYLVAWRLEAPTLAPVVAELASRDVRPLKPRPRAEETPHWPLTLPASEVVEAGGPPVLLSRNGDGFRFALDGASFELLPARSLSGPQSWAVVEARHPQVVEERSRYADTPTVRSAATRTASLTLPGEEAVVRVYFGSWSSASLRLVPRIAALEDAWRGGEVRFEYYGLKHPWTDDAVAVGDEIVGVPTVVVRRGDREVGRMTGRALADPATGLLAILDGRHE